MKKQLLELVICPYCIPHEYALVPTIIKETGGDIETGELTCPHCAAQFPIIDGIAMLDPFTTADERTVNKYETEDVVSSYLWSHYADLFADEQASQAYSTWGALMRPQSGLALDAGGAVGRFTFEMSTRCDFAIGIDTSVAFIKAARDLMQQRSLPLKLKEEGFIRREVQLRLPEHWQSSKVDFVVANALALPFKDNSIALFSSLNLVDKVPSPLGHLEEMNRVTRGIEAQFLLSDPFSWSTEAAPVEQWLGGKTEGPFSGKGLENVADLLTDDRGSLRPVWQVDAPGSVWWKIRTHRNHYELIRSCYIHATR